MPPLRLRFRPGFNRWKHIRPHIYHLEWFSLAGSDDAPAG